MPSFLSTRRFLIGISQRQLARQLRVDQNMISLIERGLAPDTPKNRRGVMKLIAFFGLTPEEAAQLKLNPRVYTRHVDEPEGADDVPTPEAPDVAGK